MIRQFHRSLVLRLRPEPVPEEPRPEAGPQPLPLVEFVAYTEDAQVQGHVRLDATRLSDALNSHERYVLVDAVVHDLAETRAYEFRDIELSRDELMLVHATGPRGDSARRTRTRQHPIAVSIGPYLVKGYLHAVPGSDAIMSFRRRRPMVPLTDAWIEYSVGGRRQHRAVSTVIVNRHLASWVAEAADEEITMPDVPASAGGPLVKDFTGYVFAGGGSKTIAELGARVQGIDRPPGLERPPCRPAGCRTHLREVGRLRRRLA